MPSAGLRSAILTLIMLCALTLSAQAEKRVALVIGNSAYKNVTALPNPVNDANAVAALFRQAGFEVVENKQNLDVDDLRRAIRDFSEKVRDSDIAVVYYAGHGIEIDGSNYLVPVDAALARDIDVEDETLSVDRILRVLEPARRLRVVILDACRDNPFTRSMRRTVASRSIGRGLARVEPVTSDTLIAFAAKAGSTSADGDGPNSPFTAALLKHVATPGLDLRIAFGQVRDDVLKATGNKQEPFVYGSLGGSTISLVPAAPQAVASAPATVPPPAAAPAPDLDPNATARQDYEYFERVGTKAAWDAFLTLHSTGPYAELARAQRDKIIAADQSLKTLDPAPGTPGDAKPSPPPTTPMVAAVSPPQTPVLAAPPAPVEPGDLARQLQVELKRVGCYPGDADGNWGPNSRRALDAYNHAAKAKFDPREPTPDALDAVRASKARMCAPDCPRGTEPADNGSCQPSRERRANARPQKPEAFIPDSAGPGPAPGIGVGIGLGSGVGITIAPRPRAPAPGGGVRMACDRFGCKPVPPGCTVRQEDFRGMTQDIVICR
jgi:hypothetical protein